MAQGAKTAKRKPVRPPEPPAVCCASAPKTPQLVDAQRAASVALTSALWSSGETVRFMFMEGVTSWRGTAAQKAAVEAAFAAWSATGLALTLQKVTSAGDAQIRITFDTGDPLQCWSCFGTEATKRRKSERTMNFSRTLSDQEGQNIVLHEVGHALGFRHAHQNPTRGIVWAEQKVVSHFQRRNGWDATETRKQVLTPYPRGDFDDRPWDPDSVMNYEFPAGLISEPTKYRTQPLPLRTTLSAGDIALAQKLYQRARVGRALQTVLAPFQSVRLDLASEEEEAFAFLPDETRKYTFTTLGELDVSLRLFEQTANGADLIAGADDGGLDENVKLELRLISGRKYSLHVRALYAQTPGYGAIVVH